MTGNWLDVLVLVYMLVLGACLGSFINVVIVRLPEGTSLVRPRSRCMSCGTPVRLRDNIPIVSYFVLRGRCRHCDAPISARYPLVEGLMAAICGALYVRLGLSMELAMWVPLAGALLTITFLDIDHWWVPDVITFPAMGYVMLVSLWPGGLSPTVSLLGLLPALLIYSVALVFKLVTGREGLGLGDVKLLALIGLATGPMDGLAVLLLAALQGAVVGTIVNLAGGHQGTPAAPPAPAPPGPGSQPSLDPRRLDLDDPTVADPAPRRSGEVTVAEPVPRRSGEVTVAQAASLDGHEATVADAPPAPPEATVADAQPLRRRSSAKVGKDEPTRPITPPDRGAPADGDEDDDWVPPPRAIPFGPFLALGAFEMVLLPNIFANLHHRLAGLAAWLVG